ncbi:hypothetical protein [Vibrio phage vB_VpaP_SJSY21]|nr:hypothetical protein [Vibrio phage vB_VpaP_SJSY21]
MHLYAVSTIVAFFVILAIGLVIFIDHNKKERLKPIHRRKYLSFSVGHVVYYMFLAVVWPVAILYFLVSVAIELFNSYTRGE